MIFEEKIVGIYKKNLFSRQEKSDCVFYFTEKDFPNLKKERFAFKSSKGHELVGYFYSYEGARTDTLIVFDHGMGPGHIAYTKEIERLTKDGYTVFTYDHTGCAESGGESTNGFAQSLCDLNDCINALKEGGKLEGKRLYVMGHSWGAFSTMNIPAIHPEVEKAVAMSGPATVRRAIEQNFPRFMKKHAERLYEIEAEANPEFSKFDAAESLKNSPVKAMLIYSSDDKLIKKKFHYDYLKNELDGKDNIRIILVDNKGHNPNFTREAVILKDKFFAELKGRIKSESLKTSREKLEFISSFDWNKMTEQDESIWFEILEFLDK